ncbi:transcriptional adapter ADA2b-like [Chenopodium quinoa]|uniref:Transcriptional adapter n=1 Tax=Chenopodium quinoa TaxID=63459 RepID=A0A803M1J5_CHEQI|nr:transcriptional adapter ADA2b-like [Chenopodium quinoa]
MGRSRVFHSDEDPTQRSRRKKNVSSGESIESALGGQGTGDGKKALYHCNYCNKDITGRIRIKCAMCPDFDLCIECFSVGVEMTPHKSNHPYRVMDSLSFPLISPDWNADEEILLLEGLEMYGLGNWAEVAEHVGTKNKEQCINHYRSVYLNSPFFPLPDMSHVVGKNRNDLLAMAKENDEDRKGSTLFGDHIVKTEPTFSPSRVKVDELPKGGPPSRLLSVQNADSHVNPIGKKPPKEEDSSLVSLSGFSLKRHEFDPEYDIDAEQLLAEMEFKDADTEDERELKLRVLRIYSKRLDERNRRKDFIFERNLLHPSPFEKDLSPEEKAICRRYDPFMRFHSKEEHEDMLQAVIAEHRTHKRILELEEARAVGCRTSAEADKYFELKRKREAEESSRRAKESAQLGPASQLGQNAAMTSETVKDPGSLIHELDIGRYPGEELLSEAEKQLCHETKISPHQYLKMQETISVKIFSGNVTSNVDAHCLFDIEPGKIDRIYDMLIRKGVAPP